MCKFNEIGRCNKGEACPYAHSGDDLRAKGRGAAAPATTGLGGLDASGFNFSSFSVPGVSFDASAFLPEATSYEAASAKRTFEDADGGDPKRARRFKTQMCNFFAQGMCQKGESCTYAHGAHELGGPAADTSEATLQSLQNLQSLQSLQSLQLGGLGALSNLPGFSSLFAQPATDMSAMLGLTSSPAGPSPGAYKRKLCNFFLQNACTKGAGCTYAHGEHEMNPNSTAAAAAAAAAVAAADPYTVALQGYAAAAAVPAAPVRFKTAMCKFFQMGNCSKDVGCTYAHGEHEMAPPGTTSFPSAIPTIPKGLIPMAPTSTSTEPYLAKYKTVMCKFFQEGKCRKSETCPFAHDPNELLPAHALTGGPGGSGGASKTRMCKFVAESGICSKGDACGFAHNDQEQQSALAFALMQAKAGLGQ